MRRSLIFVLFLSLLYANEEDALKRINAHFIIENYYQAKIDAYEAKNNYPNSKYLKAAYIEALANAGDERKSVNEFESFLKKNDDDYLKNHLLEEISWGILNNGINSSQYSVRLNSMIGVFLTRDVRAVKILNKMMDDSNAVIRTVAIQLACQLRDDPIKEKISNRFKSEKIWNVRLALIRAIGFMKLKERTNDLMVIISDDQKTYEEKALAIEALVNIYDNISLNEFSRFSRSKKAGLRQFACDIALHLKLKEAKEHILHLLHDPNPNVRIAAINAVVFYYIDNCNKKDIKKDFLTLINDVDPTVAITASWALFLLDPIEGEFYIMKWLSDANSENRSLAAAAISYLGDLGVNIAINVMRKTNDKYVKVNLALGLIGQRKYLSECADVIFDFVTNKDELWMMKTKKNSIFQIIAPSDVSHVDHIPNYPLAIDQLTHLNILSVLALIEDSRAQDALKDFLKLKSWQVTGTAMVILLQEGDEESIKNLKKLLKDSDKDVQIQAAIILAMIGKDETCASFLQDIYHTSDYERKVQILESLGSIAKKNDVSSFFIKVFNEPFQILRVVGASSCIQAING